MSLLELLVKNKDKILEEAYHELNRAHLQHYRSSAPQLNRRRSERLYNYIFHGIKNRTLVPVVQYSQKIGRQRFFCGFEFREVVKAIDIFEEIIWDEIVNNIEPSKALKSIRLVIILFDAAKSSLAYSFISMSTKTHNPTLDRKELFKGTDSNYSN